MVGSRRSTRTARTCSRRGTSVEPSHISTPRKSGFHREILAWATASTGFEAGAFVAAAVRAAGTDCPTAAAWPRRKQKARLTGRANRQPHTKSDAAMGNRLEVRRQLALAVIEITLPPRRMEWQCQPEYDAVDLGRTGRFEPPTSDSRKANPASPALRQRSSCSGRRAFTRAQSCAVWRPHAPISAASEILPPDGPYNPELLGQLPRPTFSVPCCW